MRRIIVALSVLSIVALGMGVGTGNATNREHIVATISDYSYLHFTEGPFVATGPIADNGTEETAYIQFAPLNPKPDPNAGPLTCARPKYRATVKEYFEFSAGYIYTFAHISPKSRSCDQSDCTIHDMWKGTVKELPHNGSGAYVDATMHGGETITLTWNAGTPGSCDFRSPTTATRVMEFSGTIKV